MNNDIDDHNAPPSRGRYVNTKKSFLSRKISPLLRKIIYI
ncbi:hypothetical protein bas62_0142 [Escherichia phage JohannJBalmer]|nr:hypothetical protein bas62_0142 [Escherichia phage JohannJBalmer]